MFMPLVEEYDKSKYRLIDFKRTKQDVPAVNDFFGLPFHRPDLSIRVRPLVPGVFGLNFLSAIIKFLH